MRKAERLFQLTNLIRNKQPITAERLAEELELSVRSIYRYIDDLSVSGIPIYGTPGIGYQLDKNFELPPLNLTDKELDALMLGVGMVSSWTGDELSQAAKSLAGKIESSLPKQLKENYSRVIFAPNIKPNPLAKIKTRKNWELLHASIKSQNVIKIGYISLDEKESKRSVKPLGLFYWGAKWTLASWCNHRNDYRSFRVDRILDIEVTSESFELTDCFSLDTYISFANKQ